MGAWDHGPFDNDSAADWCADLDDAPAERRIDLIRDTLLFAIESEEYLDLDDGSAVVAAAAIIAAQLPGQPPITSPYAPDFIVAGGSIELDIDLPLLAVRALDRVVVQDDSEWAGLWADANPDSPAFAVVRDLRSVLAAAENRIAHPGDDLFSAVRHA